MGSDWLDICQSIKSGVADFNHSQSHICPCRIKALVVFVDFLKMHDKTIGFFLYLWSMKPQLTNKFYYLLGFVELELKSPMMIGYLHKTALGNKIFSIFAEW